MNQNQRLRLGMLSFAHMHAFSYANCLKRRSDTLLVGIYDDNVERGQRMAEHFGVAYFKEPGTLLDLGHKADNGQVGLKTQLSTQHGS
jgi:predicted dehydrogenase